MQNCKKQLLASLCLSVRMQQRGSHWIAFYETGYLSIFLKTIKKIHVSLKLNKNNMKTTRHFLSYLLEWEMFHTKVVEQINTHILCSITFFFLNSAVYDIMWKNIVEQSRPYDYMVYAHCMLDN